MISLCCKSFSPSASDPCVAHSLPGGVFGLSGEAVAAPVLGDRGGLCAAPAGALGAAPEHVFRFSLATGAV